MKQGSKPPIQQLEAVEAMSTTSEPLPSYEPRDSPGVNAVYEAPVRENTPLIHGRGKRKNNNMVLFLPFLVAILVMLIGVLAVLERQRIKDWEQQLERQEKVRQDEWERELRQRRLEEQLRIEDWEQQLEARREHERQREDWWQHEEEERQKLGLYWDTPVVDSHCTAYNSRKYWARLLNTVPFDYNWLKSCQDIPLVIHGKSLNTTHCYINPYTPGEVYGHWIVEFNEPSCCPYWDQLKDKGCTAEGSGRRRLEAHLEGVHEGEDEEKLCASTPYDFYGQHFDSPHTCVHYWGSGGIFGLWEINDSNC